MKKSFTLIELLVVIAIIGLLVIIIAIPTNRARRGASIARILQYEASLHRYLGSDIVGWWQFDEGEGSVAKDISGYSNDGTIHGATYVDGVPGKEGYALEFDGSGDYVDISNDDILKLSEGGTIGAWFKMDSWGGDSWSNTIVGKGGGGWANHHYILFKQSGTTNMLFSVSDGTNYLGTSGPKTPSLLLDTWYYITAVWNNTQKCIYLNGSLMQCVSSTIMPIDSAASVSIGRTGTSTYYFNGKIDDVRIYSRALTSEEINTLYTETKNKYITEEL